MSLAFSSLRGTRATLPERRGEVARVFIARRHESNISQRPLQVAPEAWSDLSERLLESLFKIVSKLKVDSLIDHLSPLVRNLITQEHQQKVTKEFYDTAGGIDKRFKQKSRHPTRPPIDVDVPTSVDRRPEFGRSAFDLFGTRKFYWEEKDEYGIYRDDQGYVRDVDGHTILVHNKDIRRLLKRASRDEHNYICLPEHASSFTKTKLVPEIYTKDEISEMFYEMCGEQENNKEEFQMKLDGVYYPLNDSISWLTTCMEEMRQDIARIQRATDMSHSTSIDRHRSTVAYMHRSTTAYQHRSTKIHHTHIR
ncbi:hypothetical protein F2Q69_00037567 [Brassica cretica]|uniref:Uncharacterized protein n=1 Tax=Brassica cretica TaxID=69181 RepID=A0A8S9SBR4_BRACR|nr:hypothetical protein F2Q69_00037567 [Brassica cretica]